MQSYKSTIILIWLPSHVHRAQPITCTLPLVVHLSPLLLLKTTMVMVAASRPTTQRPATLTTTDMMTTTVLGLDDDGGGSRWLTDWRLEEGIWVVESVHNVRGEW